MARPASQTFPEAAEAAPLKAVQPKDPMRALGLAVDHLARQPSFAALPFGHWSRTLIGQINRGHYFFVLQGDRVVGFVGWALADEPLAEAWLAGKADLGGEQTRTGDCMIINAWQASGERVNDFIRGQLRIRGQSLRAVYAKRFYADGRSRGVKLDVNAFAAERLARGRAVTSRGERMRAEGSDRPAIGPPAVAGES